MSGSQAPQMASSSTIMRKRRPLEGGLGMGLERRENAAGGREKNGANLKPPAEQKFWARRSCWPPLASSGASGRCHLVFSLLPSPARGLLCRREIPPPQSPHLSQGPRGRCCQCALFHPEP